MYAILIIALIACLFLRYYVKTLHPKGLNKINEENDYIDIELINDDNK